jgi:hypothetical protein
MSWGDIRDDWKLNEIEHKANEAIGRLHEIDSLVRDVASLEYTVRELGSVVDGLRFQLEAAENKIQLLEELISAPDAPSAEAPHA